MKEVRIIIADTALIEGKEEKLLSQIAPCYVKKHKSTKIRKDARQELLTGYLLSRYLDIRKDEQLTYNEYEKPALASGEAYFNISHSEDCVVLGIADCEIGVDVEKIRRCHNATVKKIFNTKQKEALSHLEGDAKDEKFTEIWTQCEAMLKLKGSGFAEEWDKETDLDECSIYTTKINDYIISCAAEEETCIVIEKMEEITMTREEVVAK